MLLYRPVFPRNRLFVLGDIFCFAVNTLFKVGGGFYIFLFDVLENCFVVIGQHLVKEGTILYEYHEGCL